jgi:diguanylate cyclase (GGDEF)-like protein
MSDVVDFLERLGQDAHLRYASSTEVGGALARAAWHFVPGGLGLLFLLLMNCAAAVEPQEADQLLKKADSVRTSDHAKFAALFKLLDAQSKDLTPAQQEYLRYLKGWKSVYDGDYETAIARLTAAAEEFRDIPLRFRARATLINVLVLAGRREETFSQLNQLLELLPQVTDQEARQLGMLVAAQLYNQVGQYDLGLSLAQKLIDENWDGKGSCKGGLLKVEALYRNGKLRAVNSEVQPAIDDCVNAGELGFANAIRTFAARLYIDQRRFDAAIKLLQEHYDEALRTQYPRLIFECDSLLAQAYRQAGDIALARQSALKAVDSSVKNEFTESLVTAYRLLYETARDAGDFKSALDFHEKYAAADKGYLDDVSARQLAYQRVRHEIAANKMHIEALQLERALGAKAVETSRLYILLLTVILGFIALWAYRTKRSQLHFMSLAQLDGLTGISNRHHFIKQAENALENSRKAQQDVCIILCDLDHFKAINDKHGHATGDFVLKRTVSACRAHLRPGDIFGRFGGEEFGILLPGCNLVAARHCAEQLRMTIAGIPTGHDPTDSNVSASFGVTSNHLSGYELRQLLAHADMALYQAKRIGRNRVVVFESTFDTHWPVTAAEDERARGGTAGR